MRSYQGPVQHCDVLGWAVEALVEAGDAQTAEIRVMQGKTTDGTRQPSRSQDLR
jgi:hypothetical protein